MLVRTVVVAPRSAARSRADLHDQLQKTLGRPVRLQVDQVLLTPGAQVIDAQREELRQLNEANATGRIADNAVARLVAVTAGVDLELVTLDHDRRRVTARATVLPGASLATYRVLEQRAAAAADGWEIMLVPPLAQLPRVRFAEGEDSLRPEARAAVRLSAWAAKRWNSPALAVPGLRRSVDNQVSTDIAPASAAVLSERRALAIEVVLRESGVRSVPAPPAGPEFRLKHAVATSIP